jgi:hypothetical protein
VYKVNALITSKLGTKKIKKVQAEKRHIKNGLEVEHLTVKPFARGALLKKVATLSDTLVFLGVSVVKTDTRTKRLALPNRVNYTEVDTRLWEIGGDSYASEIQNIVSINGFIENSNAELAKQSQTLTEPSTNNFKTSKNESTNTISSKSSSELNSTSNPLIKTPLPITSTPETNPPEPTKKNTSNSIPTVTDATNKGEVNTKNVNVSDSSASIDKTVSSDVESVVATTSSERNKNKGAFSNVPTNKNEIGFWDKVSKWIKPNKKIVILVWRYPFWWYQWGTVCLKKVEKKQIAYKVE